LRYLNEELNKWLQKNSVPTYEPLVVTDTTTIAPNASSPRRNSLITGGGPGGPQGVAASAAILSPPMSPEIKAHHLPQTSQIAPEDLVSPPTTPTPIRPGSMFFLHPPQP